jgi:hypothetical protein
VINWTQQQDADLLEAWADREMTRDNISQMLGISKHALRMRAKVLGLPPARKTSRIRKEEQKHREPDYIRDDLRFCKAMGAAIEAGLESPPIGIVKAPLLDFAIRRVIPPAIWVRMQSVAAECMA